MKTLLATQIYFLIIFGFWGAAFFLSEQCGAHPAFIYLIGFVGGLATQIYMSWKMKL